MKIALIPALVLGLLLPVRSQGLSRPDDVVMKTHPGDLNRSNESGGFIIESVGGKCRLMASGGPIKLGLVKGDLNAFTTAGDIRIMDAGGNVHAVTKAGNILIDKARGHVYAETLAGEINIHFARSVEVNNIHGGDVKLFNVSGFSKAAARGNVLLVIDKKSSLPALCDLSSLEGDVTVYMPEDIDADIEVRTPITQQPTRESKINSDFSFIDFQQVLTDEGKTLRLTTRINKGGARISLYIEKGDIYLKALKAAG